MRRCSVCGEDQFDSPGGITCPNGHGGAPSLDPEDDLFYIQDTRQYVGNCCLWWGPDSGGYTTQIDEAGVYGRKEAQEIVQNRGTDKAWPKRLVDSAVCRHVRIEHLRNKAEQQNYDWHENKLTNRHPTL